MIKIGPNWTLEPLFWEGRYFLWRRLPRRFTRPGHYVDGGYAIVYVASNIIVGSYSSPRTVSSCLMKPSSPASPSVCPPSLSPRLGIDYLSAIKFKNLDAPGRYIVWKKFFELAGSKIDDGQVEDDRGLSVITHAQIEDLSQKNLNGMYSGMSMLVILLNVIFIIGRTIKNIVCRYQVSRPIPLFHTAILGQDGTGIGSI